MLSLVNDCENYSNGICNQGENSEGCNKCCTNCEKPCNARCGCTKSYILKNK